MLMEVSARWEKTLPRTGSQPAHSSDPLSCEACADISYRLLLTISEWCVRVCLGPDISLPSLGIRQKLQVCSQSHSPKHYRPRQHMDFIRGGLERPRKGFWGLGCRGIPWWEPPDGNLFRSCVWCAVLQELMDFLLLLGNDFVWKSSGKGGRICLCLKSF